MVTEKFKGFEDKFFDYRSSGCPEEIFGELPKEEEVALSKIKVFGDEVLETCKFNTEKDANASYRVDRLKGELIRMTLWAVEKVKSGTYGDKLTYRVKVKISVRVLEEKKYFFLENSEKEIYFPYLSAVGFEGYDRSDKVTVTKNGTVESGSVNYYGTHAAQECFFFSNGKPYGGLVAEDYNPGDTIEVETRLYGSVEEYAKHLIGMHYVGEALDSAFKKGNGKIDGKEIEGIAREGLENTTTNLKEKKIFILSK